MPILDKNNKLHADAGNSNGGQFIKKDGSGSSGNKSEDRVKSDGNNLSDGATPAEEKMLKELGYGSERKEKSNKKMTAEESRLKELGVDDDSESVEIFNEKNTEEFISALQEAKKTVPQTMAWRVSSPSPEEFDEEHPNAKKYATKGGSTVAIASDGDIVGVCKKVGDTENGKDVNGRDLISFAVKNGGNKLDAFSGLYGFYRKQGFEPVSWTPFDEEYAPLGWKKGRDEPEPVIFWKYTGKRTELSKEDFLNKVKPSENYDTAKQLRDKELDI